MPLSPQASSPYISCLLFILSFVSVRGMLPYCYQYSTGLSQMLHAHRNSKFFPGSTKSHYSKWIVASYQLIVRRRERVCRCPAPRAVSGFYYSAPADWGVHLLLLNAPTLRFRHNQKIEKISALENPLATRESICVSRETFVFHLSVLIIFPMVYFKNCSKRR